MRKEDGDYFRKVKNFPKVTAKPIYAKGRMATSYPQGKRIKTVERKAVMILIRAVISM